MSRKVMLELTPAEARALSFAAGEIMDDPETVRDWFRGASRAAAYRAYEKLNAAAAERGVFNPRRSRGSSTRR